MRIKVRDGQFFVEGYPVKREFSLAEGEERKVAYIGAQEAGFLLFRLREGVLDVKGEIGLTRWGKNAEIYPPKRGERFLSEFETGKGKCRLFLGGEIRLEGAYSLSYAPLAPLLTLQAELLSGQRAPILLLRGESESEKYLSVLSLEAGASKVLLEVLGESIETVGNEITVVRLLPDLRRRRITSRYVWRGATFEKTSHICECTYAHPFIREDAGRLLLEAVSARDYEELRRLLSTEFAEDLETVYDYFGKIDRIRKPLFTSSETAVAIEKKTPNGNVAITYDFSFEGNKIVNIDSSED
ncbi:MAG: hypothetical protein J6Y74_04875 [Clostridia bacterium]|nr:hypothetical protein [Clostridia bacterium]